VGCSVEVHKPDSTRYLEATLIRITDHSFYTVGKFAPLGSQQNWTFIGANHICLFRYWNWWL